MGDKRGCGINTKTEEGTNINNISTIKLAGDRAGCVLPHGLGQKQGEYDEC